MQVLSTATTRSVSSRLRCRPFLLTPLRSRLRLLFWVSLPCCAQNYQSSYCTNELRPSKPRRGYCFCTAASASGRLTPFLRALSNAVEVWSSRPNSVSRESWCIRASFSTSSRTACYPSGWPLEFGACKAQIEDASFQ
jgi:hypothetical protein